MAQFIEEVWDIIDADKRYKDWENSRRGKKMIEKAKKEIKARAWWDCQFIRTSNICRHSSYDDDRMIEKWAKENGFDVDRGLIWWSRK